MSSPLARALPWLAMAAVLGYGVVHWSGKVIPQSAGSKIAGDPRAFLDFDCYGAAARQLSEGASVYAPRRDPGPCSDPALPEYVYPPTLAVTLMALERADHCRAEWIWFGFNLLVCTAVVPLLLFGLGLPRTIGHWAVATFLVLAPMATLEDLTLGQVNLQVLALLLASAWMLRSGRLPVAGLLLGWAFALKLIPVLFGLAFLRSKRTVVWPVAAGLILFLGGFWLAPGDSLATFQAAVSSKAVENLGTSTNASLVAWIIRAFDPGSGMVASLVRINTVVVVLVGCLAWFWSRGRRNDPVFPAVLMALIVAWTPLYEVHHQVLLYPALMVLIGDALATRRVGRKMAKLGGLAIVGILTNSRGLVPLDAATNPLDHLLVKPAGLALLILITWLMVRLKTANAHLRIGETRGAR